jgi:hypothetical protein
MRRPPHRVALCKAPRITVDAPSGVDKISRALRLHPVALPRWSRMHVPKRTSGLIHLVHSARRLNGLWRASRSDRQAAGVTGAQDRRARRA